MDFSVLSVVFALPPTRLQTIGIGLRQGLGVENPPGRPKNKNRHLFLAFPATLCRFVNRKLKYRMPEFGGGMTNEAQ
jgi:hypothetical protein